MSHLKIFIRSLAVFLLSAGYFWSVSAAKAEGSAKLALLIANDNYDPKVGTLHNSLQSAASVEAALKQIGFSVTVLKNADYRAMTSGLKRYAYEVRSAGKGALSFIYYAGHGLAYPLSQANYLLPVDLASAADETLWLHSIPLSAVTDLLQREAPDATHFVVLDAARSELNLASASGNEGKGLAAAEDMPNLLLAYATAPKLSAPKSGADVSPFAKALTEEIVKPDIGATALFQAIQQRVKQATGQTPWLSPVSLAVHFSESAAYRKQAEEKKAAEASQPTSANGPKAGETIRDCKYCPELVVAPAGSFIMGSPGNEPERTRSEGPQHKVTFAKPFAAGKFTVTFAEWDACAAGGGCGAHRPDDNGWGRGDLPVVNAGWDDAQAYVKWLSSKTGKKYRLLSEAEWEYVARAGTATPFWWGSAISPAQANYNGAGVLYTGGGAYGEYRQKTVPVRSFDANPWGIYQVHGNVWEWVEDCWNDNYDGAPADGSPRTTGNCGSYVVRGGAWTMGPRDLRAANRIWYGAKDRNEDIGFRVARDLD